LLSAETQREFADECASLLARKSPPCALYRAFGGVFADSHLNGTGGAFAKAYFDFDAGAYLDDFIETLAGDLPSAYHVADDWDSYDRLGPVIDRRFQAWKQRLPEKR